VVSEQAALDRFFSACPRRGVNFDIPVFEGQIDAEALEKWLTLLEGYFSVHNFSDKEKDHLRTP
jgi:hypothetical protein